MTGERWLTDQEQAAWRRLIRIVQLLPGVLDSQLRRESRLTHFEYFTLAMLSEAPSRTLRMSALATMTNATLPRLSHVVTRLEQRGLVYKNTSLMDKRATDVTLTDQGWDTVVDAAPGHVRTVLEHVIEPLDDKDIADLERIAGKIARRLDPDDRLTYPPIVE